MVQMRQTAQESPASRLSSCVRVSAVSPVTGCVMEMMIVEMEVMRQIVVSLSSLDEVSMTDNVQYSQTCIKQPCIKRTPFI